MAQATQCTSHGQKSPQRFPARAGIPTAPPRRARIQFSALTSYPKVENAEDTRKERLPTSSPLTLTKRSRALSLKVPRTSHNPLAGQLCPEGEGERTTVMAAATSFESWVVNSGFSKHFYV